MRSVLALLSLALIVWEAHADGYGQQAQRQVQQVQYVQQAVTQAPGYFTTVHYGPIASGGLSGSGQRSTSLDFTREGKAEGSLFSKDAAKADESASKTRGYEYDYK